jgi:hypothetical protein
MNFDVEKWDIAPSIKSRMSAIKEGREDDKYNWLVKL